MTDTTPQAVVVPVKSGWWSKINWATVITVVSALVGIWGIDVSEEMQKAILAVIVSVGGLGIIITKQYFNKSVTPQSVAMAASSTITASAPLPPASVQQVKELIAVGELPKPVWKSKE